MQAASRILGRRTFFSPASSSWSASSASSSSFSNFRRCFSSGLNGHGLNGHGLNGHGLNGSSRTADPQQQKIVSGSHKTHYGRVDDMAPVVIVGAGVAGSAAALSLAQAGIPVSVYTLSSNIKDCASLWAQGGIIYKGKLDSPAKLAQDVHAAGAGICKDDAVQYLGNMGPRAIEELLLDMCDTKFDKDGKGTLKLCLEAAHSLPRIIHTGDFTGRTITESMQAALLKHKNISWEPLQVTDLIVKDGRCVGLATLDENDVPKRVAASHVVLATGGIGEIFARTSNPASARGEGVALAKRAGAALQNMEYVQFHPTTFQPEGERAFLLTEAMRGEGAVLRNKDGVAFAKNYDERGELAPRDVVARLMWAEMNRTEADHVYLDISHKDSDWLEKRFPSIHKFTTKHGFHIGTDCIPVAPAAHYHCGGVIVDLAGRTNVPGLFAAGEVACTGLHGANRLASTSLLEGLVWGRSLSQAIIEDGLRPAEKDLGESPYKSHSKPMTPVPEERVKDLWMRLQQTMWRYVGVVRTDEGLDLGIEMMRDIEQEAEMLYRRNNSKAVASLWNATETALLISKAAHGNTESRGAHYRIAAPDPPRMYSEDEMGAFSDSSDAEHAPLRQQAKRMEQQRRAKASASASSERKERRIEQTKADGKPQVSASI